MRLYDCATSIRSKNAGPFTLTIDLTFADQHTFDTVLRSPNLSPQKIATLYNVAPTSIQILPFQRIHTIKITLPRPDTSSGAPGDTDVYGCQQHFPLADLEVQ